MNLCTFKKYKGVKEYMLLSNSCVMFLKVFKLAIKIFNWNSQKKL